MLESSSGTPKEIKILQVDV